MAKPTIHNFLPRAEFFRKRSRVKAGQTIAERLTYYSAPQLNGCIFYTGALYKNGYGILAVGYDNWLVHRLVWVFHKRKRIPVGKGVLHSCPNGTDNPACINPEHLRLGSQKDNVKDMFDRGRENYTGAKGSANSHAVLTNILVRRIRKEARRIPRKILQARYKVSRTTIDSVVARRTWRHI